MKSSILIRLLSALCFMGGALSSQAWGPAGHEISAEIALSYLTPKTRSAVDAILGEYTLSEFNVSSWPDIIRKDKKFKEIYPGNGGWHFIDWDVQLKYDDDFKLELSEDGNDVVTQVSRWRDELASGKLKGERQLEALRFLVHFVGDLHQPLHTSFRYGDMGGNMIPVNSFTGEHYSFGPEDDMEYRTSLHAAWDVYMVQEMLASREPKDVAHLLQKEITDAEARRWMNDDVMGWATESYWISRKEIYYFTDRTQLPYRWRRPGIDMTRENYIDSHLPIIPEQLKKAGVRLAFMLNSALDPDFTLDTVLGTPDE